MISKYGRHMINREPFHIKKKMMEVHFSLCGFLRKSAYFTEFSCQFCILNTSNFFGLMHEDSQKCEESCEGTVSKMSRKILVILSLFFGGRAGTSCVQIPENWHIRDKSRVPPGHLHLLCIEIVVWWTREAV